MSLYVLDTDTITLYQVGHSAVVRRVQAQSVADIAITVISVEEQLGGWYTRLRRTKKADELARVYQRLADNVNLLGRFRILSFTEPAIRRRDDLKRAQLNVGAKDLAIAATVLEQGAVLVTRNLQDFQRISGLHIEDWSH